MRISFGSICCGLLTAVLCSTFSSCNSRAAPQSRPHVVVIGMDGLEISLLQRMLRQDQLPNFSALLDHGSLLSIDCVVGMTSPVVWTTVATGVRPQEHGITGFTIDGGPVTSLDRTSPAFWNILPRFGVKVATVGWMVTWPAEPDSGLMVSDRATLWGKLQHRMSPDGLVDITAYRGTNRRDAEALRRFTSYPFTDPDDGKLSQTDPSYAANFLIKRRLLDIYSRDTAYFRIARDLTRQHNLDALAVYFQGSDYVGHGFWKFFEPQPFRDAGWEIDDEEVELLKEVIPHYYEYLDELLGLLLEEVEDDALVIVLSDHGFGPGLGPFLVKGDYISGNHRPRGVLILSGPTVRDRAPQEGQITHLDVLPTMLYSLGIPLSNNLAGHPLVEYLDPHLIAGRPVEHISDYGWSPPAADDEAKHSAHDREILDELRSLGYIE